MPQTEWRLKGDWIKNCNCAFGCPCDFNPRPPNGDCKGLVGMHIIDGHFGDVRLDGLNFCATVDFPGPLHEGNLTSLFLIDERADARQRQAILQLTSGKEGLPWAVFASLTAKLLDPVFARFEVRANGLSSRVSAAPYLEMELATINNPVTGKAERLQLRKPTGRDPLAARQRDPYGPSPAPRIQQPHPAQGPPPAVPRRVRAEGGGPDRTSRW